MRTKANYTVNFRRFGEITVPKGTLLTHKTAMGIDKNYHFVDEYGWIYEKYPKVANILQYDVHHHGIDVPKEFVDYEN